MSGTRRTPIGREPTKGRISDRAVDLWIEMNELPDCACPVPTKRDPCNHCRAWYTLHAELHRELQLPPWVWPCVTRRTARAAGSQSVPNDDAFALMTALDNAVRQREATLAT
jgi:hypothetical protein